MTTIEKWKDPVTAEKMRNGLLKGAETMKKKARRYPFFCPICKRTKYYKKAQLANKKYCSNKCAGAGGIWKKGVENSAKLNHQRNLERKEKIKDDIITWVNSNQETVLSCPYNKISNTLIGLRNMLQEKYDIKDLRSIFICFDVKNLKSLLDKLKEVVNISKENVC